MYTPPPNATYYSWKAEPYARGTSSILTSCFITLTLCVWTAVHLNIPKYNKSADGTWRKVAWLFTAMLAPELVALAAFCQWREASRLSAHVREVYGQEIGQSSWRSPRTWFSRKSVHTVKGKENDSESMRLTSQDSSTSKRRRHPWTRTHSFYALMGGFAIDTRKLDLDIFSHNRHRMILSVDGFKFLLQHEPDMLPDLSQAEIFDKSKASNLAKTVVCCQAVWFCAQCIARWYSDLAFSLLELNTFAHCVCALIIFVLWWNKPMDVEEPTLINAERIRELVGLMAVCSLPRNSRKNHTSHPRLSLKMGQKGEREWPLKSKIVLEQEQTHAGFTFLGPCERHDDTPRQILRKGQAATEYTHKITLGDTAKRCWRLAREGLAKYGVEDMAEGGKYQPFLEDCTKRMLVDRVGDIPRGESLSRTVVLATLAIAGFLYGGVHLAAWQTKFKTKAEGQMWKISAITLAASGPLGIPVIIFERAWRGSDAMSCGNFMISMVMIWAVPAAAALYLVARVYLIVESFLNLTYLEESTFLVPSWLQYMPHIT